MTTKTVIKTKAKRHSQTVKGTGDIVVSKSCIINKPVQEIKRLNQTAKRALEKGTPEHKKIFSTHAKAWRALANK